MNRSAATPGGPDGVSHHVTASTPPIAFTTFRGGEATPLVLLHSLATDAATWSPTIDALADERMVITIDSRGHGKSGGHGVARPSDWAADIARVLDELAIERCILVGVSMGGTQAIAAAAHLGSRIAGILVADSFARLPKDVADARIASMTDFAEKHTMAEVAEQYLVDTFDESESTDVTDPVRLAISSMSRQAYIDAVRGCFEADATAVMADVRARALVLWSTKDTKTPRPLSEQIHVLLPDAAFQTLEGAGHLPHVDSPVAFADVVSEFARSFD